MAELILYLPPPDDVLAGPLEFDATKAFPAARALTRIGSPALKQIADRYVGVKGFDPDRQRRVLRDVVRKIEGRRAYNALKVMASTLPPGKDREACEVLAAEFEHDQVRALGVAERVTAPVGEKGIPGRVRVQNGMAHRVEIVVPKVDAKLASGYRIEVQREGEEGFRFYWGGLGIAPKRDLAAGERRVLEAGEETEILLEDCTKAWGHEWKVPGEYAVVVWLGGYDPEKGKEFDVEARSWIEVRPRAPAEPQGGAVKPDRGSDP